MKKLISVFAALALVGSLAAQKGKKPAAKAPAKPAVAAPAVPAAATVAAIAPAAKPGKGVGMFIEGYGIFALSNGTSDAKQDGGKASDGVDTVKTYKLSGSKAFGGGGKIGFAIAENLSIVAGFDYKAFSSRTYSNEIAAGNNAEIVQKWNNMIATIGFRPTVNALGGTFYAGAGAAFVLPFSTEKTVTLGTATTLPSANQTALVGDSIGTVTNVKTMTEKKEYNLGIGAYGELGYRFNFTDNIYAGIGVNVLVATVDNKDKTAVYTTTGDTTTTKTVTYKSEYSSTQNTNEGAGNTATVNKSLASYQSLGVTDFGAQVIVGFRF